MAENELSSSSRVSTRKRPPLILPPRSSIENIFSSFASPGPMTLVSSFFAENSPDFNSWSFSQLLAGAMSPLPISGEGPPLGLVTDNSGEDSDSAKLGFKQNRPMNLVVAARSPLFTVPPGLSPSGFLNSPGMFSPGQDLFEMSHQQALAQVTAQAALSHSLMHIQSGYQSASLEAPTEPFTSQKSFTNEITEIPLTISDLKKSNIESSEVCDSDKRQQIPSNALDKPADDGYNWRKYGQKQVKGGECPRSYYKCTYQNCLVKKKVERSLSGQIIEIIYKGQHNHELPQCSRRAKDNGDTKANAQSRMKPKIETLGPTGKSNKQNVSAALQPLPLKDQNSTQVTSVQIVEPSVSVEMVDDVVRKENVDNDDEPNPKRRNIEAGVAETVPSHKTVTEQRIIVQTRSEVDLLDDGFRWRKYGQKVVKGNPHPRSYYKCTSAQCNVRKHVERASTDAKAVITTYEGKHNHEIPAARNSSQLKPHKVVAENHESLESRPVAVLQLKAEQIQA